MNVVRRILRSYWLYVIVIGALVRVTGNYIFGLVPEGSRLIIGIPVFIALLVLGARQTMRHRRPGETPDAAMRRELRGTARAVSFILVPAAVVATLIWIG